MDDETLKAIAGQLRKPNGDHAVQMGERMNDSNRLINLYTIEALHLEDSDNILEIGMGNGYFVKNIVTQAANIRYTGCDFSEVMVAEAMKHNKQFIETGQAQFHIASAGNMPFDDKSFDKVFTVNTVYFWEDHAQVLAEIRRVLKPKGKVYISVRPESVMRHYPFTRFGFLMFSKEGLTDLLTENNFRVVDTLEKKEPDQDISGAKVSVETLIISAEKNEPGKRKGAKKPS